MRSGEISAVGLVSLVSFDEGSGVGAEGKGVAVGVGGTAQKKVLQVQSITKPIN